MSTGKRVENKRAHFDYKIDETSEAGLVLHGLEVKAFRAGHVSLAGSFVRSLQTGPHDQVELWLINSHFASTTAPDRSRKLLLHRPEIDRLIGKITAKGLTLVPLSLYWKHGQIKVEVGLAWGKKQFEKRETIRRRDIERELRRSLKE